MKLRELFENKGNSVGVCFGRWNPPHKGHRAAWETAANFGTFYVGTNKNTEGPNDPLPYEVKLKCMETIWPEIAGHVIPEQSLFTLASRVFAKHGEATHLKIATDEEWLTKSLIQYNGKEGAHGYYKFASIEQVPTPRLSSATALRAAVRAGDRDGFSDAAGVDADTPIRIGKKSVAFFDLVAHYLGKHPEKAKRAVKAKEDAAGVGTITDQNSTVDVNKHTPAKNLRAFNLIKETNQKIRERKRAVAEGAKAHGSFIGIGADVDAALPGVWVQRQLRNTDPYMQYRYGLALAAARAEATGDVSFEQESGWAENLTIIGYTPEDAELIKMADKLMGVKATQVADHKSREAKGTMSQSPVANVKRNKYGI
jgi:hypothetical protein